MTGATVFGAVGRKHELWPAAPFDGDPVSTHRGAAAVRAIKCK
jgi:hypothetical protein